MITKIKDKDVVRAIEAQRIEDEKFRAERWEYLRSCLAAEAGSESADKIIDALKYMFSLFTPEIVDWFANLYDGDIGAWYYSNSARENPQFLPDIESTAQALGFIASTGMTEARGISISHAIPEEIRKKINAFAKGLQDENGFFYHPQWGRDATDANLSRRGRDVGMASIVFKRLDSAPTYDTPNGDIGDGISANGERIEKRNVAEVKEQRSSAALPDHLSSKEKFEAYLETLDINGSSYVNGSILEAQAFQIVTRDSQLEAEGADYRLSDILHRWLNAHQNPKTGLWTLTDEPTFEGVNGLLKITSVYNKIKKELPNPITALKSAMCGITFAEEPETVCFVLNPWYAISVVVTNATSFNSSSDKEALEAEVGAFKRALFDNYPALVRTTADNMKKFRKDDGSFSYLQHRTAASSQGMPVAVMGANEGDINATICIRSVLGHVMDILGHYGTVPMYMKSDLMRYIAIINERWGTND
jgi:hypothetical protein